MLRQLKAKGGARKREDWWEAEENCLTFSCPFFPSSFSPPSLLLYLVAASIYNRICGCLTCLDMEEKGGGGRRGGLSSEARLAS